MKITELVGKWAYRTNSFRTMHGQSDYSYTNRSSLFVVEVTKTHIYIINPGSFCLCCGEAFVHSINRQLPGINDYWEVGELPEFIRTATEEKTLEAIEKWKTN